MNAEALRTAVNKQFKKTARKGEADRFVTIAKPKHLFSGKRKGVKADRR